MFSCIFIHGILPGLPFRGCLAVVACFRVLCGASGGYVGGVFSEGVFIPFSHLFGFGGF